VKKLLGCRHELLVPLTHSPHNQHRLLNQLLGCKALHHEVLVHHKLLLLLLHRSLPQQPKVLRRRLPDSLLIHHRPMTQLLQREAHHHKLLVLPTHLPLNNHRLLLLLALLLLLLLLMLLHQITPQPPKVLHLKLLVPQLLQSPLSQTTVLLPAIPKTRRPTPRPRTHWPPKKS
jgi:hypothetical protein